MRIESFTIQLYEKGIIKFGAFTLKSGISSPFYIDMRILCAYPSMMRSMAEMIAYKIKDEKFQQICGVPYAALSVSTIVSQILDCPQILMRKEQKKYGTKNLLEGVYQKYDQVILIDDVLTSGMSFLESIKKLSSTKLLTKKLICIINREQGGVENLRNAGYEVDSLFNMSELAKVLLKHGKITDIKYQECTQFITNNRINLIEKHTTKRKSYEQIRENSQHDFTSKLLDIVIEKKSNLCFSADIVDKKVFLETVDVVGTSIALLKTHIDIINDVDKVFISKLKALAKKYNFLILEDRKFADIGNTVKHQYESGVFDIASWADAITIHTVSGSSSLHALASVDKEKVLAGILIAQMSTIDTLTDEYYIKSSVEIARKNKDVVGIVSQSKQELNPGQLHFTPGIKLQKGIDEHGQQYESPTASFINKGTDIIIVGRGIYQDKNPAKQAAIYKQEAWQAYLNALN